jgi:hypothetical protein
VGAKLTIEGPSKFALVDDLKGDNVLNLTIADSLLARADEVVR